MPKNVINIIIVFVSLVIAQAVIFNNLVLFNCAVALVFIFLIVELPITMSLNVFLTISFLLGLSVDIFQDTPGLNALTCTIVAFIRKPIFYLYVPRDEDFAGKRICINTLGTNTYLKYMLTVVLAYCVIYFPLEVLSLRDFFRLLLRLIASTAFTFIVLFAIDSLTVKNREKRL